MKLKTTLVWTVLVVLLFLIGCSRVRPVYNVESSPVSVSLTADQVERAIVVGGVEAGWKMAVVYPGTIEGVLHLRNHVAKVTIKYDISHYSITYKDSENLLYKDGHIHRNYNGWIQNLDNNIQKTLLTFK